MHFFEINLVSERYIINYLHLLKLRNAGFMFIMFCLLKASPCYCQLKDSAKSNSECALLYNGLDAGIALRELLSKNLIYPSFAFKNNLSGKVYVSFTVDPNDWVKNRITNIYVAKGVHPSLDYAAVFMIKNIPDQWQTGLSRGTCEPVKYILPISFDIDNVTDSQITDSLDFAIIQLLGNDSLSLDSILYGDRPEVMEMPALQKGEIAYQDELGSGVQLTISGRVFDNHGNPLHGAVIVVQGTPQGLVTDEQGSFSLTFEKGRIISISFIGFITEELKFDKNQKKLKIRLREDHNY